MLEASHLAQCFPVRTELVLKGIHPANQNFQVKKGSFFPNRTIGLR
jgi:hypothetical protein